MRKKLLFAGKVFIAVGALLGLVSVPAQQIAPDLTLLQLAGFMLGGAITLTILTVASLTVAQWVLRAGSTDTQWFWFSGEPPGLQDMRQAAREDKQREL